MGAVASHEKWEESDGPEAIGSGHGVSSAEGNGVLRIGGGEGGFQFRVDDLHGVRMQGVFEPATGEFDHGYTVEFLEGNLVFNLFQMAQDFHEGEGEWAFFFHEVI